MSLQDIFLGKSRWSNIKIRIRSNQTRALYFREYQKGIQGLVTQRRPWMKSEILCVNLKESPWIHCIYLLMFGPLKWGSDNWHLDRTYMCYPASSCKLSKLIRFTFIQFISPFAVISMLHCNSNGILFCKEIVKSNFTSSSHCKKLVCLILLPSSGNSKNKQVKAPSQVEETHTVNTTQPVYLKVNF